MEKLNRKPEYTSDGVPIPPVAVVLTSRYIPQPVMDLAITLLRQSRIIILYARADAYAENLLPLEFGRALHLQANLNGQVIATELLNEKRSVAVESSEPTVLDMNVKLQETDTLKNSIQNKWEKVYDAVWEEPSDSDTQ